MPAIRAQVPGILALAVPISAGLAASTLMGAVDAVMLAPLGPLPLAAVGLTSAATVVPLGVAGAVAIRVAQEQGPGNRATLRPVAPPALAVATLWLAGAALFLALAGRRLADLITGDAAVAAMAAAIMGVFALMQVLDGLQSTMVGALRGLSDTAFPAAVTAGAFWGCALPMAWALSVGLGLGPAFVRVGWLAALATVGAVLLLRFLRCTRAA